MDLGAVFGVATYACLEAEAVVGFVVPAELVVDGAW